jgi:serine phosphatase RsbU (regulator of sigma subunit)
MVLMLPFIHCIIECTTEKERIGTELHIAKGIQEGMLPAVKESIDEFVGEAPQFDDITMLCFKYKGTS